MLVAMTGFLPLFRPTGRDV